MGTLRARTTAACVMVATAAAVAVVVDGGTASAAPRWRIAPPPAWVAPPPAPAPEGQRPDDGVAEYLLDDTQVRVSDRSVERFRHISYRPRSPGQVEGGSQLAFDFDPSFEHLTIHYARIVRDGRTFTAFAPGDVRVVQREKDLEERIYDGRLSALIFLRDVRVNDVIDYAYTIEGRDPLLGGKYVASFQVADESLTRLWRRRVLLPAGRSLDVRAHGTDVVPAVTVEGPWRQYLWQRRDVAPVEVESELPSWFEPMPWVEISEFRSWAEVAALYGDLFAAGGAAPGSALAAQAARIRALAPAADDRLLEATRFVQDEIRYLGLEVGLSGHAPFAPPVTLERRFGDCKDKAALLSALLAALGYDARPALVNTTRVHTLDDWLPSPYAFDHAIVAVTVGGVRRFIDPTTSYQRGPIAARQPPDFERALIVAPGTSGLTTIDRPRLGEPDMAVREIIAAPVGGNGTELDVETTLRGGEADGMRSRLAATTRQDIARKYLNYYAQNDPGISLGAELRTTDDERRNLVVLRERYRVPDFWRDGKREMLAATIRDRIPSPRIRLRRMPFALQHPLHVSHVTVVRLPSPPDLEPEDEDIADDHIRFRFTSRVEGSDLVLRYELETLADAVPPEKAKRFFEALDRIGRRAGYVLTREAAFSTALGGPAPQPMGRAGWIALGTVAGLVLLAVGRGTRAWTRRRAHARRGRFASGEAAATAIHIGSLHETTARVAALGCSCGGKYGLDGGGEDGRVTYDGRTLLVRTARCASCSRTRPVFFDQRAPETKASETKATGAAADDAGPP